VFWFSLNILSQVLLILTDAPQYVPNALIKHDLQVLTVRQEVRNYSVTYRQRLDDIPTTWHNLYFTEQTVIVGLSDITPQI